MTARARARAMGTAALLALTAAVAAPPASAQDAAEPVPQVTLAEALARAARLDPDYVAALGQVGDATWLRRSTFAAFVLPSVQFSSTATRFSSEIFNVGTGESTNRSVDARLEARYDVFTGGAKWAEHARARAELESASANEREARFRTALLTEADYYDAWSEEELLEVARERVRRAEEQLEVARARVLSGAAVQSDSLQLLLELTRARVDLLGQESAVRVARYQLGRRIGHDGPVRPVPLDTIPAPALPISEAEAIEEARAGSPQALEARAEAEAAEAGVRVARSAYFPRLSAFGSYTGFDDTFFPRATTRTLFGLSLTVPLWDNAQRELSLSRARTGRAVARALRDDVERAVAGDVVEAYQTYESARASAALAAEAVGVAREILRVQDERYRAGATTILDLLTAQVDLTQAQADLVQARTGTRLALAGLEAILGRRLFPPDPGGGS